MSSPDECGHGLVWSEFEPNVHIGKGERCGLEINEVEISLLGSRDRYGYLHGYWSIVRIYDGTGRSIALAYAQPIGEIIKNEDALFIEWERGRLRQTLAGGG